MTNFLAEKLAVTSIHLPKPLPSAVQEVMRNLKAAGYQAVLIGSAIPDWSLYDPLRPRAANNNYPNDWDIYTDAGPDKLAEIFRKHNIRLVDHSYHQGGRFKLKIDIPVYHPQYQQAFLTSITTSIDICYSPTMFTDEDCFMKNLRQRDFTRNAVTCDETGKLFDPLHGLTTRTLQPLIQIENAILCLRAVRMRVKGFWADKNLIAKIRSVHISQLFNADQCPPGKLQAELIYLLLNDFPHEHLIALSFFGLLSKIFPAANSALMMNADQFHADFQQELKRAQSASNNIIEKLAYLCAALLSPEKNLELVLSSPFYLFFEKESLGQHLRAIPWIAKHLALSAADQLAAAPAENAEAPTVITETASTAAIPVLAAAASHEKQSPTQAKETSVDAEFQAFIKTLLSEIISNALDHQREISADTAMAAPAAHSEPATLSSAPKPPIHQKPIHRTPSQKRPSAKELVAQEQIRQRQAREQAELERQQRVKAQRRAEILAAAQASTQKSQDSTNSTEKKSAVQIPAATSAVTAETRIEIPKPKKAKPQNPISELLEIIFIHKKSQKLTLLEKQLAFLQSGLLGLPLEIRAKALDHLISSFVPIVATHILELRNDTRIHQLVKTILSGKKPDAFNLASAITPALKKLVLWNYQTDRLQNFLTLHLLEQTSKTTLYEAYQKLITDCQSKMTQVLKAAGLPSAEIKASLQRSNEAWKKIKQNLHSYKQMFWEISRPLLTYLSLSFLAYFFLMKISPSVIALTNLATLIYMELFDRNNFLAIPVKGFYPQPSLKPDVEQGQQLVRHTCMTKFFDSTQGKIWLPSIPIKTEATRLTTDSLVKGVVQIGEKFYAANCQLEPDDQQLVEIFLSSQPHHTIFAAANKPEQEAHIKECKHRYFDAERDVELPYKVNIGRQRFLAHMAKTPTIDVLMIDHKLPDQPTAARM